MAIATPIYFWFIMATAIAHRFIDPDSPRLSSTESHESIFLHDPILVICLEDHPRTCKWLITMVSKSPKWGYSPYKWPKWLINGGY